MTREELEVRYQLVEQVTEGDVRTHHAVAAGGTVVMVHFVRPGTPRGDAVLERVKALGEEEAARLLRRHEVEGEVVLVTRFLMDEGSLERWLGLDDQHSTERSAASVPPEASAPGSESGAGDGADKARERPSESGPAFGDAGASPDSAEEGPGEFTRMFKRMDPPGAPPEAPPEQDEQPGEFTRLFKAMEDPEDPPRSGSRTDSPSATPSADSGTGGGPAREPRSAESPEGGIGKRAEDPGPQPPTSDPGERGGGGEFTRLFQAIRPGPGEEEPGPPPPEPSARPRPPAASGPSGSFTQEFGRVPRPGEEDPESSGPRGSSLRPPDPPPPLRLPSDAPPPPPMPDYRSPSPGDPAGSRSGKGGSSDDRQPDDYLDRLQSFGPPEGGGPKPPPPPPPAPGGQGPPPPPSRSGEAGSRGASPPPGAGGGRAGPSEFTQVISAVRRGGGGPQVPRPPASPARPSAPSTGAPGGSGDGGGKGPSNVLLLVGIVVVFLLALAVILVFALMGGNGEGEAEPEGEEATEQVDEVDAAASTVRPQAHLHFSATEPLPPGGG